jgi:2-oxoglutarate ferredoxin oxidoreductase subunit gamma
MDERIIVAGFGGQGVLSMGKTLAEAAMEEGREVTWLPSYGPEMRGGTSNCSVIISDKPIGAPTISQGVATCAIVLNKPSLDKFENFVAPGGLLIINESLIDKKASRTDIDVVYVKANDISKEAGTEKAANMAMLGAYIGAKGVVKADTVLDQLAEVFGEAKKHLVDVNRKVIEGGIQAVS